MTNHKTPLDPGRCFGILVQMSTHTPHIQTSRAPHVQQAYDEWFRLRVERYKDTTPPCPFCGDFADHKIIERTRHMIVVENQFPYEEFDGKRVDKHYMIVPLEHADRLMVLPTEARAEYMDLYARYHEAGFSSFTRSVIDTSRSIPLHLHTHLFSYK